MNPILTRATILAITVLATSACTKEPPVLPLMTCTLSPQFSECTPMLTLQTGQLTLMPSRDFILKGQYNACFHKENIIIQGRYKNTTYPSTLVIELLATHIEGLQTSDFPSTIAVVTLDKSTLKGITTDIWANIRSPIEINKRYVSEITCKPD